VAGGKVRLGRPLKVDRGVLIGYKPDREVADLSLAIGPGARLRSGTVIYLGSDIGSRLETGHGVVIREENEIGDGVWIWSNTVVDYGSSIGSGARLHTGVYVAQYSRIGEGAFLAPGVKLLNDPHPGCALSRECMMGPTIGRNAVIGGGCVILPMVRIGDGAFIGAGSVVTRDIPAGAVAWGVPARIRGRKSSLRCTSGHLLRPYRRRGA
jgi:acetyltransferase-like isoleucine patch superfamily enzyme